VLLRVTADRLALAAAPPQRQGRHGVRVSIEFDPSCRRCRADAHRRRPADAGRLTCCRARPIGYRDWILQRHRRWFGTANAWVSRECTAQVGAASHYGSGAAGVEPRSSTICVNACRPRICRSDARASFDPAAGPNSRMAATAGLFTAVEPPCARQGTPTRPETVWPPPYAAGEAADNGRSSPVAEYPLCSDCCKPPRSPPDPRRGR
jgi:hypothetical protein